LDLWFGGVRLERRRRTSKAASRRNALALYELRTYSLYVGKLAEARELYQSEGWPALSRHEGRLVGYFIGDVGAMNQIVHLWKFADDADRRRFWETVYADETFMAFARKLRPLIRTQENKLLLAAPWGPHP
jgi:NIPSNAP